jgi:hypothetical protein
MWCACLLGIPLLHCSHHIVLWLVVYFVSHFSETHCCCKWTSIDSVTNISWYHASDLKIAQVCLHTIAAVCVAGLSPVSPFPPRFHCHSSYGYTFCNAQVSYRRKNFFLCFCRREVGLFSMREGKFLVYCTCVPGLIFSVVSGIFFHSTAMKHLWSSVIIAILHVLSVVSARLCSGILA